MRYACCWNGSVALHYQLPDGIRTVVLHSVLHVPKLTANLVSLGTLQQAEEKHYNHENRIMVTLQDEELFHATFYTTYATLYHIKLVDNKVAFATTMGGSMRL